MPENHDDGWPIEPSHLLIGSYDHYVVYIMDREFEGALAAAIEHSLDPDVVDDVRRARKGAKLWP